MSTYNESTSSAGVFHQISSNFAYNNMVSSPTTSRSGMESDGNMMRNGINFNTNNSTCPETNVARYAESLNVPIRGNIDEDIFEMDHSVSISKDIGAFFNDSKLYDYTIKVKKQVISPSSQAIFVSDQMMPFDDKLESSYETFRVHRIVLAAR